MSVELLSCEYNIICDECDNEIIVYGFHAGEAKQGARNKGWETSVFDEYTRCPECVERENNNER